MDKMNSFDNNKDLNDYSFKDFGLEDFGLEYFESESSDSEMEDLTNESFDLIVELCKYLEVYARQNDTGDVEAFSTVNSLLRLYMEGNLEGLEMELERIKSLCK